jgi:hypothetical protein
MAIEPFAGDAMEPAIFGGKVDEIIAPAGRAGNGNDAERIINQSLALALECDTDRMSTQAARELQTQLQS